MSIDGLMIRALTHELQELVGGRIAKIYQPAEDEIILQIRAKGANRRLLLSANPTYPRVHLTEHSRENPLEPPMFCMLLRKHCEGGILESVRQEGLERILHLDVRNRDELGDMSIRRIVVEIMGRHSNIILLDPATGQILDGIRHVTPALSTYRVVMPGSPYKAPPEQHKADPLNTDRAQFERVWNFGDEDGDQARKDRQQTPAERLVSRFSGLSPLAAREIVHRALTDGKPGAEPGRAEPDRAEPDLSRLYASFRAWMDRQRDYRLTPTIIVDERTGKEYFSTLPLTHIRGRSVEYPSVNACLEAYFRDKAEKDKVRQSVADMIRFLQNERSKNVKKLDKLQETLAEARDAERYREIGELMMAQLHRIQRGDTEVELVNYYDEEARPIKVELDPQLSPAENAQRYFKKYAKAKNSLQAVQEQLDATRKEIDYLDGLLAQLEHATLSDAEEIREELVAQGYLRERRARVTRKRKNDRPPLTCYTSSEGVEIYVGKNNLQNEYLTNRLARASDTWLHAKDIPGSHVVIRAREYGDATLEEAAMLAAYYSKARASSLVPVDYTLIRHVRKPNGAKPGFVIYDHQKTLFITPDEQRLQQLKMEIRT
jgi:predicted ribosome quality control (RQC) complex YloA/Tae2 family protein